MLAARKLAAAPQTARDRARCDRALGGWRGARQILLAVAMGITLPSCLTYGLWSWASERSYPGHVAGVVQEQDTKAIVYSVEDDDGDRGYVAMTIPVGFSEEDLIVLASTSRGDALAIRSRAFGPYAGPMPESRPQDVVSARLVDYRETVGRVELPEGHPRTGLVQLLDEDGRLLHEVYVYDDRRCAWVRVGMLELGEGRARTGRVVVALVVTPVSLAADALAGIVVLWDMMDMNDRRNSWYSDAIWTWGSSREEDAFAPVSIEERERYWESLGAGRSQRIARSPSCVSLPGDWIFELRTDR